MRPFDRLPLCGIARSLPPVVFSHSAIHFQRSSGFSLWNVVHRQHLVGLVLVVAVDDVAMQVVAAAGVRGPFVGDEGGERPGSLYFSMMAVFFSQKFLANFGSVISGGSFLFDWAATNSIVAFLASMGPRQSCRASA